MRDERDKRKTSTWRMGSILIAILDIIGCIIVYGLCVYVIYIMVIPDLKPNIDKGPALIILVVVFIVTFFNSILLKAAILLFNATNMSTDTKDALDGAKKWRVVATVCIIILLLGCLVQPLQNLIAVVIRLIMFAVVHMYIRDMKRSLGSNDNQT